MKNKLETNRYNWDNPYVVNIKGYVNKPTYVVVPLSNMKRYFTYCVNILLKENNINVKNGVFASKTLPNDVVLLTQIKNPIEPAINDILQKSNNFTSETLFKLASSKKYDTTGSDALSVKIFQEFYSKLMKSKNKVIVHDGCGVSRNNMMYTDWMTDALLVLYKEKNFDKFKEHMAHPGTGTLKYRLSELQNGAYLKTGTLAHVSSITGYITSQDGNIYAAAIITQGFNQNSKEVKAFEDKIIRLIYSK